MRYSDELYHFGIPGMKWGVRRFQKKDGTRTPAGEKRYASVDKAVKDRRAKIKKMAKRAAIAGVAVGAGYMAYKGLKGRKTATIGKIASRIELPKQPVEKQRSPASRSRTAKEALAYLNQKHKTDAANKPKKGRTAKEAMAYLDQMHKAKGHKSNNVNFSYSDLKKKHDRLTKAVNAQQAFLNSRRRR